MSHFKQLVLTIALRRSITLQLLDLPWLARVSGRSPGISLGDAAQSESLFTRVTE
jgi:hypothetical protein